LKLRALIAPATALCLVACGNSSPLSGSGLGARADAARFLTQATFGPRLEDIDALSAKRDYETWLVQQRDAPMSFELPRMRSQSEHPQHYPDRLEAWWRFAVTSPDQLRQRMAFALSQIMVVSDQSLLASQPEGTAYYYDLLIKDALGNFRDLLDDVTLAPAMGQYLNMWHNQKPNPDNNIRSDENYAREVMQLFTIGLVQLNLDGTPMLDDQGKRIPTFSQSDVANLARVLTGWSWGGGTSDDDFNNADGDWTRQMDPYEVYHDETAKVILSNTPVPAGMQARPELKLALDTIFNHPNVGPFISRQLIQRLVTSNPSPAYVERVAKVFNDNGAGERGDLFAVAKAILLDPEARGAPSATVGKLREPVMRPALVWRAFHARADNDRYDYFQAAGSLAESPLSAPSVFNFFRPEFSPIGVISRAGLVAPEFGITNAATAIEMANEMRRVTARYRWSTGRTSQSESDILLDFSDWEAKAADPARLLDDLGLVLMCGQMPAAMRTTLLDYLSNIPADHPQQRVGEAVYLIVSSPQYAAQC